MVRGARPNPRMFSLRRGAVRTPVAKKSGDHFDDTGAHEMKTFVQPVQSFHVRFRPGDALEKAASSKHFPARKSFREPMIAVETDALRP